MSKLRRDERERLVRMFTRSESIEGPMYHSQHLLIDGEVRDRLRERGLVRFVREDIRITEHGAYKRAVYEITIKGRDVVNRWRRDPANVVRDGWHPRQFEWARAALGCLP